MSRVLDAILRHAAGQPQAPALADGHAFLSYAGLREEIGAARALLRQARPRALALALENSPAWAVADLAALAESVPVVPLPAFFSAGQQAHALRDAGADWMLTDDPAAQFITLIAAGCEVAERSEHTLGGRRLMLLRLEGAGPARLPRGTAKVTYTSGTTGRPKGVCLAAGTMEAVASSLALAAEITPEDRHLAALPLATLLENVGGVYAPLLAGACAVLLPLRAVGLAGAARFDAGMLLTALWGREASSVILTPQMLQGLTAALGTGLPAPHRLRFVALGGAPASPRLLEQASGTGLPVYEGYGLSECGSVVALNTRSARRPGSVGRPLPHVRVSFAPDGEILVSGAGPVGFAGEPEAPAPGPWRTGDLGRLDADGYLHITGRKKNLFITSFGRNVAPEWVERELTLLRAVAQAALFGEGRPWNVAVIVPRCPLEPEFIERAIAEANAELPDYARVRAWIRADAPFTPENGQLTVNGRLKRDAILAAYRDRIDQLYREELDGVS